MRKRFFGIIISLIFLGMTFSCWGVLNKSPEAKNELVAVAAEREYERIPIDVVRADGRYFLVLPRGPFFLEVCFSEESGDWFFLDYDEEVLNIRKVRSWEVEDFDPHLRAPRLSLQAPRLHLRTQRIQTGGRMKFLVTPKLYRGKLDISSLKIPDCYDQSLEDYLKEEEGLEVNSREVKEAAAQIRQSLELSQRDNPYFLIKATLAWLDDNIVYSLVPKHLIDAFSKVIEKMPPEKRTDPYSLFLELRKLVPKVFSERFRDWEISDSDLEIWTETYHSRYGDGKDILENDPYLLSFKFLNRAAEFSTFIHYGGWYEISAKNTLKDRLAKCSGIDCAFVAICRSFGIPAKKIGGMVVSDSVIEGFHAWAIVYLVPYGWVEVDPTFKDFEDFSHDQYAYDIFWVSKDADIEVFAYK